MINFFLLLDSSSAPGKECCSQENLKGRYTENTMIKDDVNIRVNLIFISATFYLRS